MVGPRPSDAGWRDIDAGKTKPDLEGSGFFLESRAGRAFSAQREQGGGRRDLATTRKGKSLFSVRKCCGATSARV
ncbi:hypothetical protein BGLA2_3320009 [Burkholderia gladioli]|nr:hypothetical protein BGLA2_3320009 [Burkholderia gladioli]